MLFKEISLLIVSLINLTLALLVYLKRRCLVTRLFAFLVSSVAGWAFSLFATWVTFGGKTNLLWGRVTFTFASLIPLSFLWFAEVFPKGRTLVFRKTLVIFTALGFIFALFSFSPWMVMRVESTEEGYRPIYGYAHPLFGLYLLSCFGYGFHILVRKWKGSRGIGRVQIQYLFLGVFFTILGGVTTNLIIPTLFHTSRFSFCGPYFSLFFFGFVSHAIIRYRFMDIKIIVKRGGIYLFSLAGAVGLLTGLFLLFRQASVKFAFLPPSMVIIGVLSSIILFQPIKYLLQILMERYFYRPASDYKHILQNISRASSVLDLDKLLENLSARIIKDMKIDSIAIYLYEDRENIFLRQITKSYFGNKWDLPHSLAAEESAVVKELQQRVAGPSHSEPFLIREEMAGRFKEITAQKVSKEMNSFRCDAVFSLALENRLIGLLFLGQKLSGEPYFQPDLDLLSTISNQAAIAIGNAQLHKEVKELEERKRKIERLNIMNNLASGLLHQIKNSLVALKTFAELLPERHSDPDFLDNFSKIALKEVEQIDSAIKQLRGLAFSSQIEFADVTVEPFIESALASLADRIRRGGIQVLRDYAGVPPIRGNKVYLQQLFLNLLLNSIQAMPQGGKLYIKTRSEAGFATVEISDTGVGIDEENLDKVFQPFFTTKKEGMGLGLTICRNIVDIHNGTIQIRNREKGGVAVILRFPTGGR